MRDFYLYRHICQNTGGVVRFDGIRYPILSKTNGKYRELYEQNGNVDNVIHNLHTSSRQFYRYLDIAYMNPIKANQILSGKLKINVNDLFQIARENQVTML